MAVAVIDRPPLGVAEVAATRAAIGWPHAPFEIPADIRAGWDARARGAAAEAAGAAFGFTYFWARATCVCALALTLATSGTVEPDGLTRT